MYHVLILTDHTVHSGENSMYALAEAVSRHPLCQFVDIASRGTTSNKQFFDGSVNEDLQVLAVREDFSFDTAVTGFEHELQSANLADYDVILLRLPPPASPLFYDALCQAFDERMIVNRPSGILKSGSKEFLLNFPELCPYIKLINDAEQLKALAAQMPLVLKPLRSYGGIGVVRVVDGSVDDGTNECTLESFIEKQGDSLSFLAMEFLPAVTQGDKRVIVCGGKVLGASLRIPKKDDWLCNVSRGGTSVPAEVDPEEHLIARTLWPAMKDLGVVLFGFDTLVGKEGKRVLSEINTTSVGGLMQLERQAGKPVMSEVASHILNHIDHAVNAKA